MSRSPYSRYFLVHDIFLVHLNACALYVYSAWLICPRWTQILATESRSLAEFMMRFHFSVVDEVKGDGFMQNPTTYSDRHFLLVNVYNLNISLENACSTHAHKSTHRVVDNNTHKKKHLYLSTYRLFTILYGYYLSIYYLLSFIIYFKHPFALFSFNAISYKTSPHLLYIMECWGAHYNIAKYDPVGDTANGFIPISIGETTSSPTTHPH